MILEINPTLFQSQDDKINEGVLKLLDFFVEDRFIIDFLGTGIVSIFFNDNGEYIFANSHLASYILRSKLILLENKIKAFILSGSSVPAILKFYLTTIKVGIAHNEIHPIDVCKIIQERSIVVIENYPNDWKFIEGIIRKYENFGKRKTVYQYIKNKFDKEQLIYDHAGGSGIFEQLKGWVNGIYALFYKYRLMVFFDSDKKHSTDFKNENRNLLEYIKQRTITIPPQQSDISYETNDLVVWHILYKRAIENYVPVYVIIREITNLTNQQKANILALSPQDIDFLQYHIPPFQYISIGKNKAKEQFPEMFLSSFHVNDFEQRCLHHKTQIDLPNGNKEYVSELEQILLKIAKIV